MTFADYVITAPVAANGPAVPIEGTGTGNVETISLPPDRDWLPANGWVPVRGRSGDAWMRVYYDSAEYLIKDRPEIPDLPAPGPAPATLDLVGTPDGSTLTVTNEAGDSLELVLPLTEALTLTEPGTYRLEVAPPFPHLPLKTEIIVSA